MSWKSWTVCHMFVFLTFLISGLVINLIQGIAYVLLPKTLFRRINYYLQWSIYGQFIFLFDWWSSSEVRLYGPSHQIKEMESVFGHEHALILCNHHYETDWLFGWCIAERFNVLGGAKVFMKAILKYVPVLGWGWNLSDIIYVKRNWSEDQKTLPLAIQRLQDYPHPFWLLIFAEGTRFTQEKFIASKNYMAKANDPLIPDLKHHLIPRTKGFSLTLMNLDFKKVPAIYDVTLVANKEVSTLSRVLNGLPISADVFVRRIALEDTIEKQEDAIDKFLMKTYKEKDDIVDNFINLGHFGENTETLNIPKRRIHSLVNVVFLNVMVLIPFVYYFIVTLLYGSYLQIGLILAVFSFLYFGMKKMIGITKFKESSSYGGKKVK